MVPVYLSCLFITALILGEFFYLSTGMAERRLETGRFVGVYMYLLFLAGATAGFFVPFIYRVVSTYAVVTL